jgi:elongation factor 1 alpha-like protein
VSVDVCFVDVCFVDVDSLTLTMSRHRNVRNLAEEDYYDYDDDYYDDDDYYEDEQQQQQQQTQTLQQQHVHVDANFHAPAQLQPQFQFQSVVVQTKTDKVSSHGNTGSTATSMLPGVAKPPPGWGKPTVSEASSRPEKSKTNTAAGIAKPPPGWGKPASEKLNETATSAAAAPPPTSHSASGSQKGTKTAATSKTTTATSSSTSTSAASKYAPKPLPDVLKQNSRSQLSMVVLGHVDAGKSTLMGQLLVQVGQVSKRQAQKTPNISWLLDENESERERGVTMEIGTKGFSLANHDVVILDAPGHADFIPIMITGAANADVAILVVAGVTGEFEAGFDRGGQTKEHVLLARGLGVSQVIVAINKLDVEGWSEARYQEIQSKVKDYLRQQQFAPKRIRFVPLSGLTGENVRKASDPELLKWYNGPTLLEAIDSFQTANRQVGMLMCNHESCV